jgi:iron complex outermembrane receptor protein
VNLYYAQINFLHGPEPTPSESTALFGHAAWAFNDRMGLSLGARFTDESKTYIYRRRNPDGTLPVPCPNPAIAISITEPPNCLLATIFNVSGEFEDSRSDWRAAFNWRLTDDAMLYTQAATGYKGGGINPRPFFLVQIESFQPEELI